MGIKIPLLIMAGSRFLSRAEKNYALVELELESNSHAECTVKEMKKLLKKMPSFTGFRQGLIGVSQLPAV